MVRKPHVAFYDLFLDTPTLTLANNDAYLRVRFSKLSFRKKGVYKLFYKDNPPPPPGAEFLSRREVRTDLSLDKLNRYPSGGLPGAAADLAYAILDRVDGSRSLVPVCLVSSFRRYFTMRSPDPGLPDFLNLSIEQSTAFAARDIDMKLLLESGFIDLKPHSRTYDFELSEAELTVEGVPAADAMFRRLVRSLAEEFGITVETKYPTCLRELDLSAGNLT